MDEQTSRELGHRKRDPERRKQEILTAATEIVAEQGAAALTHRAVSARGGVPLGTMTRHFPSIDGLREAALRALGDESDTSLDMIEQELSLCRDVPQRLAELIHEFLGDTRQVQAMIALVSTTTYDASLRSIALRWTDRLTDILGEHMRREQAVSIEVFLDGAIVHAALHDRPLSLPALTRAIRAILAMPEIESEEP